MGFYYCFNLISVTKVEYLMFIGYLHFFYYDNMLMFLVHSYTSYLEPFKY